MFLPPRIVLPSFLTVVACSVISSAGAATTSTTFSVTASVIATCEVSATDLAFGSYDPLSATDLDATNTITVTCTDGTSYDVGLNEGAGVGASVATRKLTSGLDTLDYTLYQDSARTTVWGNTVLTDTLNSTASSSAANHTVYGRITSGQNVPAGAYSDTITVTVTY